jgi:aerobic carbon-monoxide dehydrogenase small subunit
MHAVLSSCSGTIALHFAAATSSITTACGSMLVAPRDNESDTRAPFTKEENVAVSLAMTVNGKPVSADVDPRTLLVDFLRNQLALTGTHVGCDTAQCGACTVHLDGQAIKACNVLAVQAQGASIVTIEGLIAEDGTMHPMQAAFRDCHGLQCGFCTPGMVMSAIDLVNRHPQADEATIRAELEGNLCRCTGYHNIVKAVRQGAAVLGK